MSLGAFKLADVQRELLGGVDICLKVPSDGDPRWHVHMRVDGNNVGHVVVNTPGQPEEARRDAVVGWLMRIVRGVVDAAAHFGGCRVTFGGVDN